MNGQVFNVVDDELPTSRHFLLDYKRQVRRFVSLPVPYPLDYLFSSAWEAYSERSNGQLPPRFNRRRCRAEWLGNRYSNDKLKRMLGWKPRIPLDRGSRLFFDSLREEK